MCTSPILILNKRYRWLSVDTPRKYIQVPCGSCDECLRRRAADLFVRADYEWKACLRNGGCGFMCCLTYSNDLLPYLEIDGIKYMVFNKKDVIDFLKRLRVNLDRMFRRLFGVDAPDFKYLVTSEFGTDPDKTHRPHYHIIFFFMRPISLRAFRTAFIISLVNQKTGQRYFGKIFQCDPLDVKRGGIRYSSKYILKDLLYETQRKNIIKLLNHERDRIEQEFGIIPFPECPMDEFKNKCVRASKEYRKAVSTSCLRYRHMLQFYLCSNDLGVSAIINRYGTNISQLPLLNVGGFAFALPKAVKTRFAELYGVKRSSELSKSIFIESFRMASSSLAKDGIISWQYVSKLTDFINEFVFIDGGFPYLSLPNGCFDCLCDSLEFPDNEAKESEYRFMSDNDFYTLRSDVLYVIRLFNSPSRLALRRKVAHEKSLKEKSNYESKKRNHAVF